MKSGKRDSGGFSLIEVLIAMAVVVLAFAVLTETFFNTLLALEGLEANADRNGVIRFARSQIILEPDLDEFERGGEIETLHLGRTNWNARVEPTEVTHLFRVELTMEFTPTEGTPFTHTEVLHLLRPTWSDPLESTRRLDDARSRLESERRMIDAW